MSDPTFDQKINKKKLENIERLKKKREIKISKNKQKKLNQIAERKRAKQTRESLFDELQQYQLDAECFKLLASTSGRNINENGNQKQRKISRKLRCVSTDELQKQSANKRQQKGYIETDDSSSNESDGEESVKEIEQQVEEMEEVPNSNANLNMERRTEELKFDTSQQILQKIKEEEAEKAKENRKKLKQAELNFYKILSKIKGQHIFVQRSEEIEKQKRRLPINADEQHIVEAINENTIIIICGETGSGKTTQVPQFLYEAGYTSNGHLIGVTEPRRIAAISMASRVGQELGAPELASYQIKYEGNRTEQTKILFMTDGVLLKELQSDFTLSRYSVIVIDEAHERSIYSDVLIGLLSRICLTRLKKQYPLKLIIMSATLRLDDFLQERLFPNIRPKVLNVDSRQFPVSIYFERRTPEDYLEAAFKKICKIHEQYPPGGILVFLSGQMEVHQLIKKLERKYPNANTKNEPNLKKKSKKKKKSLNKNIECDDEMTLDYDEFGIYDMDQTDFGDENLELNQQNEEMMEIDESTTFPPLLCLPLYSMLPSHLQKRVFLPTPEDGSRICIVATNVAETSLTIPNITYVVDSGKEKRREYDPITGVSRFVVDWCSKASANQRSGRAGRVKPGNAYRLYSSAVFEDMQTHSSPEILNKPIEQLVLFLKSMGFGKLTNFPFPTPPKPDQMKSAELRLTQLGALTTTGNKNEFSQITPLGCTLVQIPLAPSFAKVLVSAFKDGLLPYALTLVSALSVREPLIPISAIKEKTVEETKAKMTEIIKQRQLWSSIGEAKLFGDLTVILHLIGAADYEKSDPKTLISLGIRPKALDEINKLRSQLVTILNTSNSLKEKLPVHQFKMVPPSQEQLRKLRRIMVACFPDKIAKRKDEADSPKGAYKAQVLKEFVFLDNSSVLFKEKPEYILYQEIIQMEGKKNMQNLCVVDPEWIPNFVQNSFINF